MVMKKLLIIYAMLLLLPIGLLAQNDSISKTKNVYKNQIALDVGVVGMSFSFNFKNRNTHLSLGLKTGFGSIVSSTYKDKRYLEHLYIQPIINWTFKKIAAIETGPRVSVIRIGESSGILAGISLALFIKIWKIQFGTRSQMSYVGGNRTIFKSSILFSQEAVILRIPLTKWS